MNNVYLQVKDDETSILSREKVETLTEIVEALQNIAGSSFWQVLQKNIFYVELAKSKRRLENETNPTEIYRLQGEIKLGRKYDLEKLLTKYRDELSAIRK